MRPNRLIVLLVSVAVALAAVGCSSNGSDGSSKTTTTKAKATTTTEAADSGSSTTTTPGNADAIAALKAKMVPDVEGYQLQPDNVGDTGPSDLAKAKRDDGTKEGAAQLEENGFELGYQELFVNKEQDQVIVFVYQFETEDGAKKSCDYNVSVDRKSEDATTVTPITVPGVPTLYAASADSSAQGFSATLVEFVAGRTCARIIGIGKTRAGFTTPAPDVAARQYALLK
jgi:hypothetical protein